MNEVTKQNLAIILITILLASSVYIFVNFIMPSAEQRKDLGEKIIKTREKMDMLQDYQEQFNLLVQNYENLGSKIDMINQALPSDPQTAQVLATLDAISRKTNLPLNGLNFNTQAGRDYNILEIKTDFSASYEGFKAWLKEIERELRLFDLDKISIRLVSSSTKKASPKVAPVLQFSLELLTYYQI